MDFNEYTSDEIRDWLSADVTKAYLAKLGEMRLSFQQDAMARARAGELCSYQVGKSDGVEDAISIARGPK